MEIWNAVYVLANLPGMDPNAIAQLTKGNQMGHLTRPAEVKVVR